MEDDGRLGVLREEVRLGHAALARHRIDVGHLAIAVIVRHLRRLRRRVQPVLVLPAEVSLRVPRGQTDHVVAPVQLQCQRIAYLLAADDVAHGIVGDRIRHLLAVQLRPGGACADDAIDIALENLELEVLGVVAGRGGAVRLQQRMLVQILQVGADADLVEEGQHIDVVVPQILQLAPPFILLLLRQSRARQVQ